MITNSFHKHATIGISILGLWAINAAAATFTVMNANDGGAGSLRDALAQTGANNQPDTITFDPAVFNVQRTITLTSSELVVPPDSATTTGQMVTITGPGANLLTITGNNQRRVFFLARYAQASISGLTITGGNATGTTNPAFNGSGGGVYVYNGALNLDRVVVSSNSAISGPSGIKGGGGVYYDNAQNSTIANSTFSNNLGKIDNTYGYGGAVYFSGSQTGEIAVDYTITNSTFTLNRTGGSSGSSGSTIYVRKQGNTASISNSIIENNFSSGIEANRPLTVENTIVRGNVGTGIYPGQSSNIRNSTIDNNGGNGFYVENSGTTNITNSTISNNALLGLFAGSGLVNLDSSTITLNRGGGVQNSDTNFFGTNLRNTIVAGNTASGSPKDISGTITSQGYNIIGTTAGGTITPTTGDQLNVNPMLAPLADNGGATQTHALMPGSPAIDAANPANFPAIDQRGVTRPQDGDGNGSSLPDIGAFERQPGGSTAVSLASAVSRKLHGSAGPFDLDLLAGTSPVESRTGGANSEYTIILTFLNPLASVDGVAVTSGTGSVSTSGIGADAHQYVVNLTGVTNAQRITVTLTNVTDSLGNNSSVVAVRMGVLVGDTTGNGSVSASDVAQVKGEAGQAVTASNFRADVNVSGGSISASDIGLVKSYSGSTLP